MMQVQHRLDVVVSVVECRALVPCYRSLLKAVGSCHMPSLACLSKGSDPPLAQAYTLSLPVTFPIRPKPSYCQSIDSTGDCFSLQ